MSMKKVREMIVSAPSKRDAIQMLETWRIFKGLNETDYQKGRLIIKEIWN
jgi:hypothetical protein